MMKKSITLSIPTPCHEQWNQMTPTEKGKFCAACSKEVIDFTQSSDEHLFKSLQSKENLCGRFRPSQLNRKIHLDRKKGNSLLPYAASLMLPLTVLSNTPSAEHPKTNDTFKTLGIGSRPLSAMKSLVTLQGRIIDSQERAIPFAKVEVQETGYYVTANKDGLYTLKCASGSTLIASKDDLSSDIITVGTKNSNLNITIEKIEETVISILGNLAPIIIMEEMERTIDSTQTTSQVWIKGVVSDEGGQPLPGVNIVSEGMNIGTQTDFDGYYEIQAPPEQQLHFSYVGYETKIVTIANIDNRLDVQMLMDEDVMGEMIIVGYAVTSCVTDNNFKESSYQVNSEYTEEQREKRLERKAYAEKVNAFKTVQAARKKAERIKKRSNRRK